MFTSPVGVSRQLSFDSVIRQKTYQWSSWSGHEQGLVWYSVLIVWARLQCTHVLLPVRPAWAVPARGEFCPSAFV